MKKKKLLKTWLVLCICIIAILGHVSVKAAKEQGKECTMMDMHKCVMESSANCQKCIENLSKALALLDEAVTDVDAGKTADAKMKINKAQMMLRDIQAAQKECIKKMPTCNTKCPITGQPINRMNTPQDLTRIYKGKKVGFCCPACPPQWDKLSDKEKEQKLEKVMPKSTEKSDEKKTKNMMHEKMKM